MLRGRNWRLKYAGVQDRDLRLSPVLELVSEVIKLFHFLAVLLTLVYWNAICIKVELQLQWIGDVICVEITKIFYQKLVLQDSCVQVHRFLYDAEESLRLSGQGF